MSTRDSDVGHTALPLQVIEHEGNVHVYDEPGHIIATFDAERGTAHDLENAERVASRWNNHAALVEALRAAMPLLGGWREMIALWDEQGKDPAVGANMWACLDQIDRTRSEWRDLLSAVDSHERTASA